MFLVSYILVLVRRTAITLLLTSVLLTAVSAQTSTSGTTPSGLAPGAPAGSYAMSGFDNVNIFNGNLNFHLPLLTIGGRGKVGYSIMLTIDSKRWTVQADSASQTYTPDYYWWTGFKPELSPGVMNARSVGSHPIDCPDFGLAYWYTQTLTRLTFTTPDGTEYEFRDALTNGAVNVANFCNPNNLQPLRRGRVWVCGDGSATSFISDNEFYDNPYYTGEFSGPLLANGSYAPITGYLLMRDGTRYRIENNKVTWIRDVNGNKVTVTPTLITDALNRTFGIATDSNGNDTITFKGFNVATRQIKIWRAPLSQLLRSDFPLPVKTYQQLFTALSPINTPFDPTLVSAVELPDGRRYEFKYDYYGELAKVTLPTGGSYEYDWAAGPGADADGIVWYSVGYVTGYENYINVYRRVKEKRVFSSGTNLEGKTIFSPVSESGEYDSRPWTTVVKVEQKNAGSLVLGASKHYFNGSPKGSFISFPFDYPEWDDGREYRTDALDSDSTTMLQRSDHSWLNAPGAPVIQSWQNWHPYARKEPPNNSRDVEVLTSLKDVSPNKVSKRSSIDPTTGAVGFDQYNNQTDVWEYDYGQGTPGSLLRHTSTQYLTSAYDTVAGTAINPDVAATVHIRSLPTQQSVYDAGGVERARTAHEYDNYNQSTSDVFHASLRNRPNISGLDSSSTTTYYTRGNITKTTRAVSFDSNGGVTSSISDYAQYDIAGNVVKALDPRSTPSNIIATTFDFDDSFGSPNGDARENTPPLELGTLKSYAFPTLITNALGHTVYTQLDYYLGKPVDSEDANQIKSSGYYNDLLDRPTEIWRNVVDGVAYSKRRFIYDDTNRTITTQSDQTAVGDFVMKSLIKYDGLGRTTRGATYEGNTGSANTWAISDTQFDALGRVNQVSNPFRDTDPVTAAAPSGIWTSTAYDGIGRVLNVTTPDLAVVTTTYLGNQTTVRDQANKQRRSVTDGLGRLAKVFEDPAGSNFETDYSYDALGNLMQVDQGSQQRFFTYDSSSRLLTAKNPEEVNTSGQMVQIIYAYDSASNLLSKTGPNTGSSVSFTYDGLNRVKTKTLSSGGVWDYTYDTATISNAKGRLVSVVLHGATDGCYYDGYDAVGRVTASHQVTSSGTANSYSMSYGYDLAGNMTRETYPSTKVFMTEYDNAGRIAGVRKDGGNYYAGASLTDATNRIQYTPHGAISAMKLGNGKWEHTLFNGRLQPTEIGLGANSERPIYSSLSTSTACWSATCSTQLKTTAKSRAKSSPRRRHKAARATWF